MAFDLIIITLVILTGVFFLLAEIFLLPGMSIAGIAGGIFLIGGVAYAYMYIGATAGHIALIASGVLVIGGFIYFIKSKSLNRISLKTNIDSKVDNSDLKNIRVGDEGITLSRLNPIGKVLIKDLTVEAKSFDGEMIDENTKVIVNKVGSFNILVSVKTDE